MRNSIFKECFEIDKMGKFYHECRNLKVFNK